MALLDAGWGSSGKMGSLCKLASYEADNCGVSSLFAQALHKGALRGRRGGKGTSSAQATGKQEWSLSLSLQAAVATVLAVFDPACLQTLSKLC